MMLKLPANSSRWNSPHGCRMNRLHLAVARDRLSRLSAGTLGGIFAGQTTPSYVHEGVHTLASGETVAQPASRGAVKEHATSLAQKPLRIPKTAWQEGGRVHSSNPEDSPASQDVDGDSSVAHDRSYFSELFIRDFALVAEQQIKLRPGLNVITGESGSGKSVLVSALGHILGGPTSESCIRPPAKMAVIEGRVHLSPQGQAATRDLLGGLEGLQGLPVLDAGGANELVLRREISVGKRDGGARSRCFVNGQPCALRTMREIGNALVDINGQHAAQALRDTAAQLRLLDRLAGAAPAAAQFGAKLREMHAAEAHVREADALGDEAERQRLQSFVDEIAAAGVGPGEERELRATLRRMDARRASLERCALVRTALQGDSAGGGGLQEGVRAVESHVRAILAAEEASARSADLLEDEGDEGRGDGKEEAMEAVAMMEAALQQLDAARDMLSDVSGQVGGYARRFRWMQQDHDEVAERLRGLERLFKQWECSSSEELLAKAEAAENALERWAGLQGKRGEAEASVSRLRQELAEDGAALSVCRREAAGKLRAAVEASLADLAMAGARFDVRVAWQPGNEGIFVSEEVASSAYETGGRSFAARPTGFDCVEFLLAAGPAEPLRPLAAVASGGESARVMLALKAAPAVTAAAQDGGNEGELGLEGLGAPVLVLDELDTGVGGRLGQAVGRLLRRMSAAQGATAGQLLCVSHLPQVAAHAEHHICVRKGEAEDGRPITHFEILAAEGERVQEVAAMLGLGPAEALQLLTSARP